MTMHHTEGISLYYEQHGNPANPPVVLLSGLNGDGKSWSNQIERFAADYFVVVPHQRGTGQSSRTAEGHSTRQLATDIASLVEHLNVGPAHVVGNSTGGAIAQYLALDHPHTVATLTLVGSFARFDAFMHREFAVRRTMADQWDRATTLSGYSLFLFSPRYIRAHPDRVAAWIDRAAAQPFSPEDQGILLQRIDMIAAHDTVPRLQELRQPTLVLCGEQDFCAPLALSQELADAIPGAQFVVFAGCGHLVELEDSTQFFRVIDQFLTAHRSAVRVTDEGKTQDDR